MFALLSALPSDASPIQDQAFEPASPNTIPTICGEYRWAQCFTVGLTGTLTRVDVLVAQRFGVQAEDLDITIFDTIGGVPHLPVAEPFHIPAASVPIVSHVTTFEGYAYLRAAFTLPVAAGDVLAIVVSTGSRSQYYWAGVSGGTYPRALYQTFPGAMSSNSS